MLFLDTHFAGKHAFIAGVADDQVCLAIMHAPTAAAVHWSRNDDPVGSSALRCYCAWQWQYYNASRSFQSPDATYAAAQRPQCARDIGTCTVDGKMLFRREL